MLKNKNKVDYVKLDTKDGTVKIQKFDVGSSKLFIMFMNDFDFYSTLSEWDDAIRVRKLFLCLSGPALKCAQLFFTTVTGEDGTQRNITVGPM